PFGAVFYREPARSQTGNPPRARRGGELTHAPAFGARGSARNRARRGSTTPARSSAVHGSWVAFLLGSIARATPNASPDAIHCARGNDARRSLRVTMVSGTRVARPPLRAHERACAQVASFSTLICDLERYCERERLVRLTLHRGRSILRAWLARIVSGA